MVSLFCADSLVIVSVLRADSLVMVSVFRADSLVLLYHINSASCWQCNCSEGGGGEAGGARR